MNRCSAATPRYIWRNEPASAGRAGRTTNDLCAGGSSTLSLHRLGRRYAEERESIRDGLLDRGAQRQARLGQGLVVGEHTALGVEAVERGGEVLRVVGEPVGSAMLRRPCDLLGETGQEPEQVQLGFGTQHA